MRTITLKDNNIWGSWTYAFSIPKKIYNEGNELCVDTVGCSQCRETATNIFASAIMAGYIDLTKARILFTGLLATHTDDHAIIKILDIINTVENAIGFSKTTVDMVVYKKEIVKPEEEFGFKNMLMFSGSNKWYRSPQTMSLYLLLLRIALKYHALIVCTDMSTLVKSILKLPHVSGTAIADQDIIKHFKAVAKLIVPIMKNINLIFPSKRTWKHRFDAEVVNKQYKYYRNSIGVEGIFSFVSGASQHIDTKRFVDVFDEKKIKYDIKCNGYKDLKNKR